MKNKLIGLSVFLATIFSSGINASALEVDFSSMDYNQQRQYIETLKTDNKSKIDEINIKTEKGNKLILDSKNKILKIKKESQSKRNFANYKSAVNNDTLKKWEVVLKSDNLGDMLNSFQMIKTTNISKNRSISLLEKQEDYLTEEYLKAEKELKVLETEKAKLEQEKTKIEELEENLKKQTERKNGEITFDPANLLSPSNMSVEDMYHVLKGTGLYELAPVYIEAENTYGVNALFIAGLSAEESGWGTSRRAIYDNNLTGLGVYSNSSKGINAYTKRDNILMTTRLLKNSYLTPGGSYYNGLSIQAVNTRYCIGVNGTTDYNWSAKITSIATGLLNKVNK